MKNNKNIPQLPKAALAASALLAVLTGNVHAQSNVYWTGSAGANWDSTSWSTTASLAGTTTTPTTGATLNFRENISGAPTNRTMNNDFVGLSVASININHGDPTGYELNGNALTLTGANGIIYGATSNTINLGLVLNASEIRFQGGALLINGNITEIGPTPRAIRIGSNAAANNTTLTLSGNNSFSGTVNVGYINQTSVVNINTLGNIGVSQSLGTGSLIRFGNRAATGTVVYTGGTTSTDKTWALGEGSATAGRTGGGAFINNGSGAVIWTGAKVNSVQNLSETRNFTLGGTNTGDNTWQSAIKNNSTSGTNELAPVSFTKTGAGKWILSGANTYTGATTVSEGTLLINGSTAADSAVTVASGAVFGGNGTVNGNLTLDNGAFFAFDTAYTLDLDDGSTFALNNSFGVASLRNLNGGAIDWGSIGDGTYTLIQGANLGSGFFSASNISNFGFDNRLTGLAGGREAYFTNGSLQLVVIPEPGTLALMGITGLALLAGLRRRK
jgi:autotransporter-associated beta strand protein